MSISIHPGTSMYMGDPDKNPLEIKPNPDEASTFFNSLILSASGWRGVFGQNDDDMGSSLTPSAVYIAGRMALVFANFLQQHYAEEAVHIIFGIDTRPTGPALAEAMIRVLLARGIAVHYGFIMSAPEIMAAVYMHSAKSPEKDITILHRTPCSEVNESNKEIAASYQKLHGFCYISASHNPPGHNGIKFGLCDGGVLPPDIAKQLIAELREGACSKEDIDFVASLMATLDPALVRTVFTRAPHVKRQALSDYLLFSREVFTNVPIERQQEQEEIFNTYADEIENYGVSILAELNGSSRSLSIDENFITSIGASYLPFNNIPGHFVHRIVPEGESLMDCAALLAREHVHNDTILMGYVPDCDGDRGNIVIWDEEQQKPRLLEAQETFALAVLSELAAAQPGKRHAVVCNDATSLRIDAIAEVFGAVVFRTETGEANVVSRARELRKAGWEVRILGEGSNGGVIIHPSSVRDPLSTLGSLLKLTALRGKVCPFRVWLECTNQGDTYFHTFSLSDIAETLPAWTTTSVFESRAALTIKQKPPIELKRQFFMNLPQFCKTVENALAGLFSNITFEIVQSTGMMEFPITVQNEIGRGGLKLLIKRGTAPIGFIWMRESGTEPLFRIMVDIQGHNGDREAELLALLAQTLKDIDSSSN